MSSVCQIHVHTLMLTSALSWPITAWRGNKNKCQKVLRYGMSCLKQGVSYYYMVNTISRTWHGFPWVSVAIGVFLDAQDAVYWEKSDFSAWVGKKSMCKRSDARLVLTVQLLWVCTARQYCICCESDMSDLLCMHDLSVWDYPGYQPTKSGCVYCGISVIFRYIRKLCVARIWKDGRPPCQCFKEMFPHLQRTE